MAAAQHPVDVGVPEGPHQLPYGSSLRDVQVSRAERDYRLKVIAQWRIRCIERAVAENPTPTPSYVGAHRAR